jgi:hypothetical protein
MPETGMDVRGCQVVFCECIVPLQSAAAEFPGDESREFTQNTCVREANPKPLVTEKRGNSGPCLWSRKAAMGT